MARTRRIGQHNRVEEIREARQLTRAELARVAGVSYDYVFKLERGNPVAPASAEFNAVADALGVTPDQLAGKVPLPDDPALAGIPDAALLELQTLWGDLTDEERQFMLSTARSIWDLGRKAQQRQARQPPGHPQTAPS